MSTTEEQIAQPTVAETPDVETLAVPETPAVPETRRDVLARELKAPTDRGKHAEFQPRDNGRFAGAPKFPTPALPVPLAPVRPEMPQTFKKELKAHWDTIPMEFAAAVHQRELDSRKGVELLQTKAQQADELLNEFKPYEMLLKAENSTPKAAVADLLRSAALLRTGTPLQKAQLIAQTMQNFGIPFQHIQQMLSGTGPQPPAPDPQYQALTQQVQQITQKLTQSEQQQSEREQLRYVAVIEKFKASPDHAHFEAVRQRMSSLLNSDLIDNIAGLSEEEQLQVAYDTAVRLDPTLVTPQVTAQTTAQQVAKIKAAASQVKGAPASGPAPAVNPKDRHALLTSLMKRS